MIDIRKLKELVRLMTSSDLTELDLDGDPFDGAVLAGNVLPFAAAGTQTRLLARVAAHLVPDGFVVAGFHTERYTAADLEAALPGSGLRLEHSFGTWDLRPALADSDFAVCVLRRD